MWNEERNDWVVAVSVWDWIAILGLSCVFSWPLEVSGGLSDLSLWLHIWRNWPVGVCAPGSYDLGACACCTISPGNCFRLMYTPTCSLGQITSTGSLPQGAWAVVSVIIGMFLLSLEVGIQTLKFFMCGQFGLMTFKFFNWGISVWMWHPTRNSEGLSPHHGSGVALLLNGACKSLGSFLGGLSQSSLLFLPAH